MKQLLKDIINKAVLLGLPQKDIANAIEFLDHREFGLCFDTIITQLYEFEIQIDNDLFQLIEEVAKKMHIPTESIDYIKKYRDNTS